MRKSGTCPLPADDPKSGSDLSLGPTLSGKAKGSLFDTCDSSFPPCPILLSVGGERARCVKGVGSGSVHSDEVMLLRQGVGKSALYSWQISEITMWGYIFFFISWLCQF